MVIGSGPNGLAAAIRMAERGARVLVLEGMPTLGGGMRTAELTLPGFHHDVCAAAHPMGVLSPYLRTLPLERHGLVSAENVLHFMSLARPCCCGARWTPPWRSWAATRPPTASWCGPS